MSAQEPRNKKSPINQAQLVEELTIAATHLQGVREAVSTLLSSAPDRKSSRLIEDSIRLTNDAASLMSEAARLTEARITAAAAERLEGIIKWFSINPERATRFSECMALFLSRSANDSISAEDARGHLSWTRGLEPAAGKAEAEHYLRHVAEVAVLSRRVSDGADAAYSLSPVTVEWINSGAFLEAFGLAPVRHASTRG